MKYLSTSALARKMGMEGAELFYILKQNGWIYKKDNQWNLTKKGRLAGGDIEYNPKFGEFVVWPSNLNIDQKIDADNTENATSIGGKFNISSRKVNLYLSELGWIEKDYGGWMLTRSGEKNGGHQMEAQNGIPYCIWNANILNNKHLVRSIEIGEGRKTSEEFESSERKNDDLKNNFPPTMKTSDGHMVRSRGEVLIDNFLYRNGIVHAYEKKLNIDEIAYCDFYLPNKKVYIEYWGLDNDPKYISNKKRKLELYSKHKFKLVEITNKDIDNLDEQLSSKLRKHNIVVD